MPIRGLEGSPGTVLVATASNVSAVTTQGISPNIDASGYSSLSAICAVSTGTLSSAFRVYLQGSIDGGATWYSLPLVNVMKTVVHSFGLAEVAGVLTGSMASLVSEAAAVTTTVVYVGTLNGPPPLVRVAWNITGASASQTFGVNCLLSI